ncbi:MAG: hypothetical protein ACLRFG_03150 [Clostridia bacterium]
MQPTYYGHHRRNLTITMIVSLIVVVAFVAGIFAIFGKSPENVTPAVIGSKIDKSIGGGRKLSNASVWDGTSSTIWTRGSGTEADPYLIESAANLAYLRNKVNSGTKYSGKYFLQTVNIDLNNSPWTQIGTSSTSYYFAGVYNGGDFGVTNIRLVNGAYTGFFGVLCGSSSVYAEIKNLNVYYDNTEYSGGAGLVNTIFDYSKIDNCSVDGFTIRTTNGGTSAGGIVRYSWNGQITNCKASNISILMTGDGTTTKVGGIVGHLQKGKCTDCIAQNIYIEVSGTMEGTSDNAEQPGVGGLVGSAYNAQQSNLISTGGTIYGTYNVGGCVGYRNSCSGYLENCSSNFDLIATATNTRIGGILGGSDAHTGLFKLSNNMFTGTISGWANGNYYIGGLVGYLSIRSSGSPITISNNLIQCAFIITDKPAYFGGVFAYGSETVTGNTFVFEYNVINSSVTLDGPTSVTKYKIGKLSSSSAGTSATNNVINSLNWGAAGTGSSSQLKSDTLTKTSSTYSGWTDFSTYWTLDEKINNGYPMLISFLTYANVNGFSGTGNHYSPYIIDSAQSFLSFANYYNADHGFEVYDDVYWQIADEVNELDLSTLGSWRPIGYDADHAFTGHLIGNQTNISNLVIDENYTYAGLFGNVASNASIEWLAVYGDIDYDIATYVGGLAGYVADGALISNCYYMGNITGYLNTTATRNMGGLIGKGAENNVILSYAVATHTAYGSTTTTTENIEAIYGTYQYGSTVGDMKTQNTYEEFGYDFSDETWKIDIQNDGYPYFNLTSCNISAFNITRDITGSGAIMVYVDGQSIPFTDNTSTNSYSAGVTITVEATASTNNAIRSLIINGTTYTSATNKNTITVNNISTTNQAGDFTIVVVFDTQYSITISNGTHSDQGSTSVTGSNITTTNPYKALKSTNITTTSTATTNTSTLKSYITGVTIDGTLVNISSADNTTTTHTINGITYTITRTKTTGFSTQIVTKITITHTLTKSITISTHYNAQQAVSTSVTLVGGDGTTTSTPTGTITADWGSTTNTLTKTEQTDKTFIGWVVNGQIESQEDTFSTQVTSSTTTITELWAVMYNISLTLPTGTESIQVTHMLTGLSYNITGATTLMAGDWIVKVPTGKTLKLNGTTVSPDSQGRYIVSITGNGTLTLS